jgi:acetyl-CoA synthetase
MDANDPFMVIFTSGTTGKPKGAVHTHGGFPLKIAHDALVHFDVDSEAVFCWPADMGWIAGSLVLSTALLRGATLVCYDGAPDFPDWSRLSRIVERHGVTHLGSAPTLIRGLANHEAEALAGDRSTLRLLITAGEAIDREHFSWFRGVFGEGRVPLINYTGGTEVSGGLLSSVLVRPIAAGAFNTVSPGVDAFVSDGAGGRLVDQPGELAIGAPFVGMTQSFWQDDERYLASYWERVPGTWVHGDLAIQRESGDFLMLGRSDDTIKVAGKRLGPGEVEDVLISLPEIADVAVIGVPDPLKGQHVVVFAVMAADWDGDEEALRAEVRRRIDASLGKAFRPGELHIVGDLPKTAARRPCAGSSAVRTRTLRWATSPRCPIPRRWRRSSARLRLRSEAGACGVR